MKKVLFLFLILLIPVFLGAQETTWINPYDAICGIYPGSMLGLVSNGMFYDEIDIILRSPAEISNYAGYTLYSAYTNYESWRLPVNGPITPVNPLTTTTFTPGNFLLGLSMPILDDFRIGVVKGFSFDSTDYMDVLNDATNDGKYTNTYNEEIDTTPLDDEVDYSYSNTETYEDHIDGLALIIGSGIDIGFMGASVYFNMDLNTRYLGGSYVHTWTEGASAVVNDKVTSKNVYYGSGEEGKVTDYPTSTSSWKLGSNGELPLTLFGFSMPVTAGVVIGGGASGTTPDYDPPMTVSIETTNVTGAADGADSSSSITVTNGQAMDTGWDPNNISGLYTGNETYTSGVGNQFRTLANNTANGANNTAALDKSEYSNSDFYIGLNGNIDPIFPINDIFRIKTRGALGYEMHFLDESQGGFISVDYSEANASSSTNSEFTYSRTLVEPRPGSQNIIDLELGGVLEFSTGDKGLIFGAGCFYHPTFDLRSINPGDEVVTINKSWRDRTDTDVNATAGTTPADIGPGAGDQGSSTETTTTTYEGTQDTNTITHNFFIPFSTKLTLVKDKFFIVGGYILNHMIRNTYTKNILNSTTTSSWTVNNTGGTLVNESTDTAATDSEIEEVNRNSYSSWNGIMEFMIRWQIMKGLTLDFLGSSVMTALNFDLFGVAGPPGFNPANIINSLSISLVYNIQ